MAAPRTPSSNSNLGQVEVTVDGTVAFTSRPAARGHLPLVVRLPEHTLPFYQAFIPFTAGADIIEVLIAHIGVTTDETMVIDNVRIMPGTRTPPAITKELVEQTVEVGATVTFSVTATGSGLSYRWLLDGVNLADGNGVSGATTATLTLADAKVAQSGTYWCS